ncbi:hypothetical protein ASE63_08310 [Bosea sp. Root381]|uniref:MerR family transcriptional regulator n=1 Tax=Bosea sp. Root381 TaxID=1736524 RepID=UPI0006FFC8F6|nr:MerR family transcriptional regulator [Bosea sp. Root381]KRE00094.1 hypothetical protein ASE63_08310 [Bosea sp. Root381]
MTAQSVTHSITDLAESFGTTLRALRFYEQRGLLQPARDGANQRIYSEADRERVAEIMLMRKLGFTVREIKSGRFPREKFAEQLALARRQRDELDQVIAELEQRAAA